MELTVIADKLSISKAINMLRPNDNLLMRFEGKGYRTIALFSQDSYGPKPIKCFVYEDHIQHVPDMPLEFTLDQLANSQWAVLEYEPKYRVIM